MSDADRILELAENAARLQQAINDAGFGPPMHVVRLSLAQAKDVAGALALAKWSVLVAVDPIDGSFKLKIDGGVWSPPLKGEC